MVAGGACLAPRGRRCGRGAGVRAFVSFRLLRFVSFSRGRAPPPPNKTKRKRKPHCRLISYGGGGRNLTADLRFFSRRGVRQARPREHGPICPFPGGAPLGHCGLTRTSSGPNRCGSAAAVPEVLHDVFTIRSHGR